MEALKNAGTWECHDADSGNELPHFSWTAQMSWMQGYSLVPLGYRVKTERTKNKTQSNAAISETKCEATSKTDELR